MDTLRTSAVSAYGSVEGTTPTLDALAAEGLVYRHAYASSAWTLPSHASLFSGLEVEEHGVGMPGRIVLPEEIVTLAERLREDGYETAAFSENLIVSEPFQMLQGFEHKRTDRVQRIDHARGIADNEAEFVDLEKEIREWLDGRDRDAPFFMFVNIFDAHSPYLIRPENPWVPESTSTDQLKSSTTPIETMLCDLVPERSQLDIIRGLYHGDVHAGDAKLGRILSIVRRKAGRGRVITLVTSDHGEFLGERDLMAHEFSLGNPVLHIPLIVTGLEGVEPADISDPVALIDIAPTVLGWTGSAVPPDLPGRPLPEPGQAETEREARPLFAAYSDGYVIHTEEWGDLIPVVSKKEARRACGPSYPVFGGMASVIRYPFKLHWFERYAPQLYDLSWDPEEHSDLASQRPELVERLSAELTDLIEATRLRGAPPRDSDGLQPEAVEALKELGYVD